MSELVKREDSLVFVLGSGRAPEDTEKDTESTRNENLGIRLETKYKCLHLRKIRKGDCPY